MDWLSLTSREERLVKARDRQGVGEAGVGRRLAAESVVAEREDLRRVAQEEGARSTWPQQCQTKFQESSQPRTCQNVLGKGTGRGVVLTDFGRRIHPEIRLLLDQAERLQSAIKDAAGVPTGTVHIGILPSMSRIFALRYIAPTMTE